MKISKVGLRKGWLDRNDSGDAVEGLAVQFALIGPPSLPILRHLRDPIRVFCRKIVELRWVFCEMVQFPIGLAMFDQFPFAIANGLRGPELPEQGPGSLISFALQCR